MKQLRASLRRIDRRGYRAYKDIEGDYLLDADSSLHIDHVQGDPFAAPSKVRLRVSQRRARFPVHLFETRVRQGALCDFLARQVRDAIRRHVKGTRGTGKSGLIDIDTGSQEVLERTSLVVTPTFVEARLQVGLPAAGRNVLGHEAESMLVQELPRIADAALRWEQTDQARCEQFVWCVDNQEAIRDELSRRGLVAFLADDSVLPRASGATDVPMQGVDVVTLACPPSLRVSFDVPHPIPRAGGTVTSLSGLGIPEGVTLLVGGGYHGKSTLLHALQRGVYPHIPDDGRTYVVTRRDAVKIRAEDGRRVENVDISPFVERLPQEKPTNAFCSDDASGSTSQAASIIEALEVGARALLIDEDTSATNFMVRDARMQALVHREHEPITPFVDRVRELYDTLGVSSVIVMGGCGDYFDEADTAILMRGFTPHDVTHEARRVAEQHPTRRKREVGAALRGVGQRRPLAGSFDPSRGRRSIKIDAHGVDTIGFGEEWIDLSGVEQLVEQSQTRAVGFAIHRAAQRFMNGETTLAQVLDELEAEWDAKGLDGLDPYLGKEEHPGCFSRPRRYEVAAAINRLRSVRMRAALR